MFEVELLAVLREINENLERIAQKETSKTPRIGRRNSVYSVSPEVKEKLAEARLSYIILNWRDNLDISEMTSQDLAQTLMRVLTEEFGYRMET